MPVQGFCVPPRCVRGETMNPVLSVEYVVFASAICRWFAKHTVVRADA